MNVERLLKSDGRLGLRQIKYTEQTNYGRISDLLRLNRCSIYVQPTLWPYGML